MDGKVNSESRLLGNSKENDVLRNIKIENPETGKIIQISVEIDTSIKKIVDIAIQQMDITHNKVDDFTLKFKGRVLTHRINLITVKALRQLQQGDTMTLERIEELSEEYLDLCDNLADIFHLTRSEFSKLLYGNKYSLDYVLGRSIFMTTRSSARIVSELMYRLSMIDRKDSMFSRYLSDKDFVEDGVIKAITVCKNFLDKKGFYSDLIGLNSYEIMNSNFRRTLLNKVKKLEGNIEYRSLTNKQARKWYFKQELKIKDIIDKDLSLYGQARQAFHLRNYIRIKARLFMKDVNSIEDLMVPLRF